MHLCCSKGGFRGAGGKRGDQPALLWPHAGALEVSVESHWIKGLVLKRGVGISIVVLKHQGKKGGKIMVTEIRPASHCS